MSRPLTDCPCGPMREVAMALARRGFSAEEIRVQMRAWCEEAAARAIAWAEREDERVQAAFQHGNSNKPGGLE